MNARVLSAAAPRDAQDAPNRWMLVPRGIPLEERTPQRIPRVRMAEGVSVPVGFPLRPAPLTIPSHQHARVLLDERQPERGRGQAVPMVPRTLTLPTVARRMWRPLFWRTWRYIRLEIETADEPLTIEDLHGIYTGYPFQQRASFHAPGSPDEDDIQQILAAGWRTARLCAHETYMDCPFYEQLQYGGDARVQMLVSLYMTGDSRLIKNGIELLDDSRTSEGATYSRAPSRACNSTSRRFRCGGSGWCTITGCTWTTRISCGECSREYARCSRSSRATRSPMDL
ncbi:MAG: hypothetical protein ABSF98_28520 [Bryobacteraceae bacterium]|jgi:hypothetical protein